MKRLTYSIEVETLLEDLQATFGDVVLYQGGGCCEGSALLCTKKSRFRLRNGDVKIGEINGVGYWVEREMFELWQNMRFDLTVSNDKSSNEYSLEGSKNKSFQVTFHLLTAEELTLMEPAIKHHL